MGKRFACSPVSKVEILPNFLGQKTYHCPDVDILVRRLLLIRNSNTNNQEHKTPRSQDIKLVSVMLAFLCSQCQHRIFHPGQDRFWPNLAAHQPNASCALVSKETYSWVAQKMSSMGIIAAKKSGVNSSSLQPHRLTACLESFGGQFPCHMSHHRGRADSCHLSKGPPGSGLRQEDLPSLLRTSAEVAVAPHSINWKGTLLCLPSPTSPWIYLWNPTAWRI